MLNNNRGMTFIEVMVAMAIIGILAHMSLTALMDSRTRAADAAAISAAKNLVTTATETFILREYVNFTHAPGDGINVAQKKDGTYAFHLSQSVLALIIGNDPSEERGYMEAYVFHTGGTRDASSPFNKRVFYCLVDERSGLTTAPSF